MNLLAARDLCAGDTPGDMTAAHLISMTHMTPLSVLLRCGSVSFTVSFTYTWLASSGIAMAFKLIEAAQSR